MDEAQQDAIILDFSERGMLLDAQDLARLHHDYSPREAKDFVNRLLGIHDEAAN